MSCNILTLGSQGSGKTMLAQRLPTILPLLSFEEALETSKIYSFRDFLSKAPREWIERRETKGLFSEYLPYAIALEVVDYWAGAFEGIPAESQDWYIPYEELAWSERGSYNSLALRTSGFFMESKSPEAGSSQADSNTSSSLSGGSSGGGFGGRGGDSW